MSGSLFPVSGKLAADDADAIRKAVITKLERDEGENVGTYTINLAGAETYKYYTIKYNDGD